jgi:hypothetical protein
VAEHDVARGAASAFGMLPAAGWGRTAVD